MNRYMFVLALMSLFLCSPALAQDDVVADEVTTEVATPEEDAVEAPEAPEADVEEAAPEAEVTTEVTAPEEDGGDVEETPEEKAEELVDEIESIEEAAEEAFALIDAIKSKNWPLAVGLILALLVFVANKLGLKDKVGPKAVPWIAMAIAVAGTVSTGLMAGLGWAESLIQGALTGVAAIGGWELILKHILGGKTEVPAEEAPTA